MLLAHVLEVPRVTLLAHPERELSAEAAARYARLIARRVEGEPVAYLTGKREFWSVELEVTPDVLIPRPETEHLVEAGLEHIPAKAQMRVADLGTGSGAVAVAISLERPDVRIVATELNPRALYVARRNAFRTGRANIRLLACDWLAAFAVETFDVIVCNPPYVRDDDPHLLQGDVRFEPRPALCGGSDGLCAIRVIAREARSRLKDEGVLLLEHGFDQGEAVRDLLGEAGFRHVSSLKDYAGHERITAGRR